MTPKKTIEILREELDEWLKWADADDAYWTAQEYLDAYELVIDALEKADKYRWHDLRKDPNDLPTKDGYYWVHGVLTNGKHIEAERKYINMTYFDAPWNFNVIAWKEMERFEEVD